jgi:PAS domain S-box-containing protein
MAMISVLYVDDEKDLLDVAQIFLEQTGHMHVGTMTSAKEALTSPELRNYDAIISDYQMPDMNGIAFLKEIRQQFGDIPFILFTGKGREEVVIDAINNGADFYLQKGGDPKAQFAELTHKIHQAVKRKQAEQRLQDSEKRLADIINFLPDATFAIDRSGHVIAWNRAIENMTGIAAADMLGKGENEYAIPFYGTRRPILIDLIFEPDNTIQKSYAHIIHEKGTLIAETSLPRPKGRAVVLMGQASPLYNGEGELVGAIESIRDITELKTAEEELRKSEERFRNLIQFSSDMIRIIGRDGNISYCSPSTKRILGYEISELIGKDPFEYIHPDDRKVARTAFGDVLERTNLHTPTEYRIRHADGHYVEVEAVANNLFDVPEIDGVVVTARPITERKKAMNALAESEIKYRELAESLPQGIFELDRELRITYANRYTQEIFGFTEEDIQKGINTLSFFDPSEHGKIRENIKRINEGSSALPEEYIAVNRTGTAFPVLVYATPVYKERVLTGLRGIVIDISSRKKMEEDLRQKNEELHAALEQITATEEELRQNYDELHRHETELRESEEKFRALSENALDGILIMDFSGKLLFANHAARRIIKIPENGALEERNLQEFIAAESRDATLYEFGNIAEGRGDTCLISCRLISENRQEIWAEVAGKKISFWGHESLLVSMRDITGRRAAEDELRRSERKFTTVFRNNPVSLIIVSVEDGRFADVNDAFLRNTGYSREEVIGRTSEELRIFPDKNEAARLISVLREKQFVQGMQLQCRIKSGEIRVCRFSANIIIMENTPLILSTIEDITEQKRAEAAQQETENKFRRIADNAQDIIYRMSLPDGKFEYISPASVAMTGYAPEDFYADSGLVRRLIHPAWQEYFKQQWLAILEKKSPPVFEYQIIDKAGKTRWFNQRNMPVEDEQGTPVAFEGIVTDITRQKMIEGELRKSELRTLAVSDNAGSWIWEVDPEGIYRYSNPAVSKILGYRPDELVGKMHFYDLFDPTVQKDLKDATLAAFHRQEPFRDLVNLNRHRNGTQVILKTSGAPVFDENGIFTGYCGVDMDITEQQATQSAIQAIVKSIVGTTGIPSLRQITKNISSWLGAECVMIGELQPDNQTVKVLSMLLDGKEVQGYTYTLQGTPCDDVAERGFCIYPDNVSQLFPESRDLTQLNIRGYIGTPLRNSSGKVFGILCALSRSPLRSLPPVQEIMEIIAVKAAAEIERSQIESRLDRSRQMLGEAMDLAHLVNWEYDVASGQFTFDDRFYALYGTTAEREGGSLMPAEVYSREFVHPDDSHLVMEEVKRALTTTDPGYSSQIGHRIIRRDGEIRHIVVRIRIEKDAEGRTVKTHGANQDITDIRKAEEALSESEEKYRSLVETSPGMIWEIDSQGIFRYISPMVRTIMGYEPEELTGKPITDLIVEQGRPFVMKELSRHVTTDGPIPPFEVPALHRNGRFMVIEIRPSRITGTDGKLAGLRGVAYDVTERKKAEEALHRANRQLTLLGSITRHDLLNKITVIVGYLKIAKKKCQDPVMAEYLTKMHAATNAITAQIEFTRIYQNLGTHEPQWIVLEEVMPFAHIPETVTLKTEVQGVSVLADPMLERVFFNLLDNSLRHGERVTRIRVSYTQSGEDLVIIWEDNGTGIPDDQKPCIFEREYGSNTGLGLFLVREILSLTGITIRETGIAGAGARFEITVPDGAYRYATHQQS